MHNLMPMLLGIALAVWTILWNRWLDDGSTGPSIRARSRKGFALAVARLLLCFVVPSVLVISIAPSLGRGSATRGLLVALFSWLLPWSLYATAAKYVSAPGLDELQGRGARANRRLAAIAGTSLVVSGLVGAVVAMGLVALAMSVLFELGSSPPDGWESLVSPLLIAAGIGCVLGVWLWCKFAGKVLPPDIVELVRKNSGLSQ